MRTARRVLSQVVEHHFHRCQLFAFIQYGDGSRNIIHLFAHSFDMGQAQFDEQTHTRLEVDPVVEVQLELTTRNLADTAREIEILP